MKNCYVLLERKSRSGDISRGDKVSNMTCNLDSKSSIGLGCLFFSLCFLHFIVLGEDFHDVLFDALSNYCIKVDRASSDRLLSFMGRVPLFEGEI
jgi:hypothetical protein